MSNPPREGGTPEVPINAPQGRPQSPPPGASGRPRPDGAGRPRPAAPRPSSPPSGAPRPPAGQPQSPRTGTPPPGVQGTQRQPIPPRGVPPLTTGSHGRLPAAQQRQPVDLATRLDGQRGWLAQLDNSLKKRSIIALILTCLAVGVGAAAMYIALTKNSDKDRLDALQTRVEALEAAAGIPSDETTGTETVPGTDSLVPETDTTVPDTGTTLPDSTTLPDTGTTDSSGLATP